MRATEKQINDARAALRQKLMSPALADAQRTLLYGMLNALVWAADGRESSTMDRLLSGEQIATQEQP